MTVLDFLEQFKEPIHILGFVAQGIWASRFLVQWIASERKKESVIPVAFWWISITGGLLTLIYALLIKSPPIFLGQLFGVFVYARNLHLIYRARRVASEAAE